VIVADRLGNKRLARLLPALVAVNLAAAPLVAWSYRPFDSTDADVAAKGEVELEFGALGFLRQGQETFLTAPAFVINFGLPDDREIVLQGQVQSQLNSAGGPRRTSLEDTGLFLKQVHRSGSLQGLAGPSLATECGILLPTIEGESGVGASCGGIFSERWRTATTHLNTAFSWTRQHRPEYFLGWILEGPNAWPLRPALELFADRQSDAPLNRSALAALIWRASDTLSLDLGIRAARADGLNIYELRAGLTWGFSLLREP